MAVLMESKYSIKWKGKQIKRIYDNGASIIWEKSSPKTASGDGSVSFEGNRTRNVKSATFYGESVKDGDAIKSNNSVWLSSNAGLYDTEDECGSIEFNQLVQNGNFGSTTSWTRVSTAHTQISFDNQKLSIECTQETGGTDNTAISQLNVVNSGNQGHKMIAFQKGKIVDSKGETISLIYEGGGTSTTTAISGLQTGSQFSFAKLYVCTYTTNYLRNLYLKIGGTKKVGAKWEYEKVMIFDLTQMFGASIADYIYGLETAHAGDGIALFRKMFPADYYPYNAGEEKKFQGIVDISSVNLRGIGEAKDEFDAISGKLTRRIGVVDLGSLSYTRVTNTANPYFRFVISGRKNGTAVLTDSFADFGFFSSLSNFGNDSEDNQIGYSTTNEFIAIRCDLYTNAESFKSAMSGAYLICELATPTEEYITPQPIAQSKGAEITLTQVSGDIANTHAEIEYFGGAV